MNDILYIYDDEQNAYKPFNVIGQFGQVRQICKGFSPNSFQILSETGCLYYISFELSFYQLPFKNEKIKYITTNKDVTLALSYSGYIYSFGEDQNHYGTLGIQKIYFVPIPSRIGTDFKQISLSSHLACALDYSGKLWSWGQTPVGNSEIPQVVNPLQIKMSKICAGKDYLILVDGSSNVYLISDSFKTSYYSNSKWIVQKFRQLSNEHLVITDILPNDRYSFALTNKNELYLLVLADLVIKKLEIRLKIHNVIQNDTHLFCLTELQQFIKIDKASLCQNEQIEMKALYEQIRFEPAEKILLTSITALNLIKNTQNSVQGFVVDKHRFEEGSFKKISSQIQTFSQSNLIDIHKQETQLKISIINHQITNTPSKLQIPQQKSRIYYSPQPIVVKQIKTVNATPLKQSSLLPKSYLSRTPNMQQPFTRSFVNYSESRVKSPVKKANLMKLLVQEVQQSLASLYTYPQIVFEFRERMTSNRCSSAQDVRSMIKEINPRANSSEQEKIQEFVHKERSYDFELTKQMKTVRIQLEGLKKQSTQSDEIVFDDPTSKQKQSIVEDLSDGEIGIQDKDPNWVQSRIEGNKNQILQSRASPIIFSPQVKQFEETYKLFEEEILIRIKSKQDRILQREIIAKDSPRYKNDENLYQIKGKDQIIIACRILNDTIDQSWEQTKNNKFQKIISKNEPTQYLEEDILIIDKLQIKKRQIRRIPEILTIGEGIFEKLQNGEIVEGRRLVENNESLIQLKNDGWNIEDMQCLERDLGFEIITQIIEEETLTPAKNGKLVRKIVRRPLQLKIVSEGQRVVGSKIIDAKQDNQIFEKVVSVEPNQIILEEVLIKKDGKSYRAMIRCEKAIESENKILLSRKTIENNQSIEGWEKYNNQLIQILSEEPEYLIEQEILIFYPKSLKFERIQIRQPLDSEEILIANSIVISKNQIKNNGDKQGWISIQGQGLKKVLQSQISYVEEEVLQLQDYVISRKLIRKPQEQGMKLGEVNEEFENIRIVFRKLVDDLINQGWNYEGNGIFVKILNENEPIQFVEEEIVEYNPKLGKMQKKLVRREFDPDRDEENQILENNYSLSQLQKQGWSVFQSRFEKFLPDILEVVEEEILEFDPQTKTQQRKLIRRPKNSGEQLENLESSDGTIKIINKRIVSPNDKNNKLNWITDETGHMQTLIESVPCQMIEEEILILNKQTGKQERKLIRKPAFEKQQLGENLEEDGRQGQTIIARRIVQDNEPTKGFTQNKDGEYELKLNSSEPSQFLEEELLQYDPKTGRVKRILRRKPFNQGKKLGIKLQEKEDENTIIVSRKVIQNIESSLTQQNWQKQQNGTLIQEISSNEPKQYIEEEVVILMKNGSQERKLIRRPFKENNNEIQRDQNIIVIQSKVILNQFSTQELEQEGWVKKNENLELQLIYQEPQKFLEEEQLIFNPETYNFVKKIIRKPFQKNVHLGNINEIGENGEKIISRKVVENLLSQDEQGQWQKINGNLEKILLEQPLKMIEEEVIIINQKTGTQERKLIRRPFDNQDMKIGDNLNENNGNMIVLNRRVIDNDHDSNDQIQDWSQNQEGNLEKIIIQSEPCNLIEEEVIEINAKTGQLERKLVRRPQTNQSQKLKIGENLQEQSGNKQIISRKIIKNVQSVKDSNHEWSKCNQGWEKVISKEPQYFVEEEVLIQNQKTGKQERKLIRKPFNNEDLVQGDDLDEDSNGMKVISRKIVTNDGQLQQNKWKTNGDQQEQILSNKEPIKYYEEEILERNDLTGEITRKLIRKPYQPGKKIGDQLQETDSKGNKILSRKVVENKFSSSTLNDQGWIQQENQALEKIISNFEPEEFVEEEVLFINPKNGTQERRIIRRPLRDENSFESDQIQFQGTVTNYKVLSKRIVPNNISQSALALEGWKQDEDGNYFQVINCQEPIKFLEEEVLSYNNFTGKMERKIVRKPYQTGKKLGENLQEVNSNGEKILARRVVENQESSLENNQKGWVRTEDGKLEKIVSQDEPEKFIEEEILVYNPKTKKQERKLVRRPLNDDDQQEIGEDLDEENEQGVRVVARRIIDNDQPLNELSAWNQNEEGYFEIQLSAAEPTQFIEEEVLVQGENGLERKLVRRPLVQGKVNQGQNLNETDENGNKVVSRRLVDNNQSLNSWKSQGQQFEKVLSKDEPEQFIEEEIIIVNPKTGKQERKLVRRPYNEDEDLGEELNESIGNNQKVIARRVVQNDSSLDDWKKNQKTGNLEKQLAQQEPTKFVEEEVLVRNDETGKMERKLIRKQFQPGVQTGNNLQETDENGNKVLSRRIVENTQSIQQVQKDGWKNSQGNYEKTLSIHEPSQYVEEEVIIIKQGGKQERKLIRRPLEDDEDVEEGEQLLIDMGNNCFVVSRKIVDNDLSVMSSKWKKNNDGSFEQSLGVEPSQFVTEEMLAYNQETGLMERKLIRKPYQGGKLTEGDQLNEVDKNGNRILSRKVESNLLPKEAEKQKWQQVGKQEEIILSKEEPEQYVEEEIVTINQKTGKLERKIIRKPIYHDELQELQLGQVNEDLGNGRQIVSRKIVQNDQSQASLQSQGWTENKDGILEMKFQPEPLKYIEEEFLVQKENGQVDRILIRRPFIPTDNKLQTGAVVETDQNGNKIVSRKIVDNRASLDPSWQNKGNGTLQKVISNSEPDAFVEEEILIFNPKTKRQERKLTRRPLKQEELGQVGEDLQEGDASKKIVARRIVQNEQSIDQLKGWSQKQGQMEISLAQNEPIQYVEEEILSYGENGLIRKLIRRPLTSEDKQFSNNLNEMDKDGNRILSRKLVDNNYSSKQLEKEWSKNEKGFEKVLSKDEPDQFIEEEIIIVNPKTGKQERKLVRRPYNEDEDLGEELNESIGNNQKVIARRVVQNDSSLDDWKKNQKTGNLEKQLAQQEPTKFVEEEVLVRNDETGKMERKLIRKQFQPGVQTGNNLQETDENGNKVLSRRIVENTQSIQQVQKDGWKNSQGNYEKTLSIHEPSQYVEEEVIIIKQGGKQERKLIRRPLEDDEDVEEGEQLLIDMGNNCFVVSRKIVDNDLSVMSSKWKKNNDGSFEQSLGVEPSKFVTEEVLAYNQETGLMERKLIRKPYQGGKLTEGDQLNEVDKNGNRILSRKVESNLLPKEAEKQKWQQVGKQEEIILSKEEPEQYVEEEIVTINQKTGKLERKIIRKPIYHDELQELQLGQVNEDLGNGRQIVSRKIVQNDQSQASLQTQGWTENKDGIFEMKFQPEPLKYIEEEFLVQKENGQVERILIRRPFIPTDNKLQTGAIVETDQNGKKIVSRKIVDNRASLDPSWQNKGNGTLQKVISNSEPDAFVEEEILIFNPKTKRQERKLTRRPLKQEELGQVGEDLQEGDASKKIVARRIVQNEQSIDQLKGWSQKQGQMEISLAQNEPIQYVEEEILSYGENGLIRKLIRRPLTSEDKQFSNNLNEMDKDGNRILSRKLVDNNLSAKQIQKEWQRGSNDQLVKIISQEEPEQYIEEEIIITDPKTGNQERKLIRKPLEGLGESITLGEGLSENTPQGTKIIARRIIQNQFSSESLQNQGWKQKQNGELEQTLSVAEPQKFFEEEVLEFNDKTKKLERKIIRRPYIPNQDNSQIQIGESLAEIDAQGRQILSRKIIDNTSPQNVQQKEGWNNQDGIWQKILSQAEPEKYIEEEIIVVNQATGKQERKIIRKPYNKNQPLNLGDEIIEQNKGYKVISRKIVSNNLSSDSQKKEGWIMNRQGEIEKILISSEPAKYIEEEILSYNKQTGQLERQLIRRQLQDNLQLGDQIQEVDSLGNTILSRKIVDNNSTQGWIKQKNGTLMKKLSDLEPEQYVEEEVLLTDKDGNQKLIIERRPYIYGEDKVSRKDGGFVLSRKVVQNNQTLNQLKQDGWIKDNTGNLRKAPEKQVANSILSQKLINQDSQYFEEEHQILNPKTQEMEVVVLKFPFNQNCQIGKRLKEQDIQGNQILSRRIVTNLDLDYNPYQFVEETVEVENQKSKQIELFSIQKQVNITEVQIGKNLNEKQPNGFTIKSRMVINQFQVDNVQGWKKISETQKEYFKQQPSINIKRSMYQIDEDSQEQRDSQYRSNEEFTSQGIRVSDFDNSKMDKLLMNSNDKRKISQPRMIEEEILVQNPTTQKLERRLQRKQIPVDLELEFGDDIYDQNDDNITLSRLQAENLNPQELMKKGWIELENNIWQRILCKQEFLKMMEEVVIEGKGNKQKIIITRKQLKEDETVFGEDLQEQIGQGMVLVRRTIVSNRSLAFYKNNDFVKGKDGQYSKSIQSNENSTVKLKIPKYQEPNFKKSKSSTSQISLIQAIEQTQITKSRSMMNVSEQNKSQGGIINPQQQQVEQCMDDQAIINRTNISDISETDKMFLKQLDRKEHTKKNSQQDLLRNRVGSDKNNRSSSSPFSDQDFNQNSQSCLGVRVIKKLMQKMILQQTKQCYEELKQLNQKYKRIARAVRLVQSYGTKFAFFKLNEHRLQTFIEFDEDDVKKYNQMLTENKIQAMEHLPEQGIQAEPIELSPDEKGSRTLVKSQSQILPKQLNFRNSITVTPQKEPQQITQNKTGNPIRSAYAPSTSIVIASPPQKQQQQQQQGRASNSRSSTIKAYASPQQQQQIKYAAQQNFSQLSEDKKKIAQNTSFSTQKSNRQLEVSSSINQSQNASQQSIQQSNNQQAALQKDKSQQQFKKMGSYSQKTKK